MRGRGREGASRSHPINSDWPCDISQRLLAHVFEGEIEAPCRILLDAGRYANAARLGQAFEAGGDIDPITEDVAALDDDITDIDPDAKFNAVVGRNVDIALGDRLLHLDRAPQRVDDAGKLGQEAVTGRLDDAPVMAGKLRIDGFGTERLEAA